MNFPLLGITEEAVLNFIKGLVLKQLEPALDQARKDALAAIGGPMPPVFAAEVRKLHNFNDAEVQALWECMTGIALHLLTTASTSATIVEVAPVSSSVTVPAPLPAAPAPAPDASA